MVTQALYTTGRAGRAGTLHMHKAPRRNQKKKKRRYPADPVQELMNLAHTLANSMPLPALKQRTGGNMLFDPTERNVYPVLFPARDLVR